MNYYIEKHDMEIILDALEMFHNEMISNPNGKWFYSIEEINKVYNGLVEKDQMTIAEQVMKADKEALRKLSE